MVMRFDDKGKIFTEVIAKDPVVTIIQTTTHRIRGCVYVRTGERLRDELNRAEQFLAVTDASVIDLQGKLLYECEFLTLNRDQIVWVMPEADVAKQDENGGDV
jgi:hypothetical protein